jgi:hypothetical protein
MFIPIFSAILAAADCFRGIRGASASAPIQIVVGERERHLPVENAAVHEEPNSTSTSATTRIRRILVIGVIFPIYSPLD